MDSAKLAERVLQRHPILSRVVGWASLLTLMAGVLTSLFEHVADLRRHLVEALGIEDSILVHYGIAAAIGLSFLVAYMLGGLWVYRRYGARLSIDRRRLLAGVGLVAGPVLAIATSWFAIPGLPDVHKPLQDASNAWRTQLLALQVSESADPRTGTPPPLHGGLRTSRADAASPPQVWSTAQSLVAILNQPRELTPAEAQQVRSAFMYIDRERLPGREGYGYMGPEQGYDWGVTEISAWVALAYAASLAPRFRDTIWKPGDDPRGKLAREIDLLLGRRSVSGGWPPIADTERRQDNRTYSTVMAVWALVEARALADGSSVAPYGDAIDGGVRWLLATYAVDAQSWVPNPARPGQQESFPGLTAQVLYVLGRARTASTFLDSDPRYASAIRSFLQPGPARGLQAVHDPRTRAIAQNDRTHDSDRYLAQSSHAVESSTYLWLPWSLAFCAQALHQPIGDVNLQEATRRTCGTVLRRVKGLPGFANAEPFAYAMAESLLSINVFLRADGAPGVVAPSATQVTQR